jgi:DNA polymerase-3 subunit epsilon
MITDLEFPSIAFVDIETTGLDPAANRIAEIGVVTVDGDRVTQWSTLIGLRDGMSRPPPRAPIAAEPDPAPAPRFRDIATDLERRLAGRLLVAHNARFDYAFLKAEFQRIRIDFSPQVLCTVMLSRRLYPEHARHDLDSLMDRHDLRAQERHRALPDAHLLWQFWQAIHRDMGRKAIADAVQTLLSAPLLPDHLDPTLIERLPEAPGVYIFHDGDDRILHIGEAGNLKLHLIDYFRVDRASSKALAIAHRIKRVTWQATRGLLGARLRRVMLASAFAPRKGEPGYVWRLSPDRCPILELAPLAHASLASADELFGIFGSEQKARNALMRLANKHYLCHALLGIAESPRLPCLACAALPQRRPCAAKAARLKHLIKACEALRPFRIARWPYPGPIGIRERCDIHLFDQWCYLGTGQGESDVHEILRSRAHDFDRDIFELLEKTLPRLPARRFVQFPAGARAAAREGRAA